ncbi:MAG: 6-bladed beta-propeller [Longimicrobiaceae bacterium]
MRASTLFRAAGVLFLPALAACGADKPTVRAVSRDSAGVPIVENAAPAWKSGEEWRLSAEPTLDIGLATGAAAYQFGRVTGAVRLSDGTVAVADAQSRELRFFDRSGRHVRTVGREGNGPGEFKNMNPLTATGDSLVVGDQSNQRVTVFGPDGSMVRAVPLQVPGMEGFIRPVGSLRDGSVLVTAGTLARGEAGNGISRDSITILRLLPGGAARPLGRFAGDEMFTQGRGGAVMMAPRAFGLSAEVAAVPDGFFYGSTDSYRIGRYDAEGKLLRLINVQREPREVTPEDVERYKEGRRQASAQGGRPPQVRQMLERSLESMSFPETLPAYSEIKADPAGNLWVRDYWITPDDPGQWTVFNPEGRMLGTVATPARVRILEIGRDYVLGAWADDLDVEHVRMFALEKPAGATRAP